MLLTPRLAARYGVGKYIKDLGRSVYEYVDNLPEALKIPDSLPPDHRMLFDFTNPDTLQEFDCITDKDTGGETTAELTMGKHGRALFQGNTSTRLLDDETYDMAGYAAIRSRNRIGRFNKVETIDLENAGVIELKHRGDGRNYFINIATSSLALPHNEHDLVQATLYTKGGPYWQVERIPFTWFNLTHEGYFQDRQYHFPRIKNVGITVADKLCGPFRLEIESIQMRYLPISVPRFSKVDPYGVVVDMDRGANVS